MSSKELLCSRILSEFVAYSRLVLIYISRESNHFESCLSSRPKAFRPPEVGELLLSLLFSLILELLGLVTEGASRLSVASETFEGILLRTLGERGEIKLFNSAFSISEQLSDRAANITD